MTEGTIPAWHQILAAIKEFFDGKPELERGDWVPTMRRNVDGSYYVAEITRADEWRADNPYVPCCDNDPECHGRPHPLEG